MSGSCPKKGGAKKKCIVHGDESGHSSDECLTLKSFYASSGSKVQIPTAVDEEDLAENE